MWTQPVFVRIAVLGTALALAAPSGAQTPEAQRYWANWRGPLQTGVAPEANPPLRWSETENVRWKTAIPGSGHSAPVVWKDRVYVLTAVPVAADPPAGAFLPPGVLNVDAMIQDAPAPERPQEPGSRPARGERQGRGGERGGLNKPNARMRMVVMALDRATGKIVWEKTVRETSPHERLHQDSSNASASPVVDGEHVFAYFGSHGLYALNLSGELVWELDLGDMRTRNEFGEGASPALHGDTLVVNWDHEGDDFIVALDKKTGKERWRVSRDEGTSWFTPLIAEVDGKPQVITGGQNRCIAYDLATGQEVWSAPGLTANVIPTPIYADGVAYLISGFRGNVARAIKLSGAKGKLDDSPAILWTYDKNTPYVPSAMLYDDALYFLDNNRPVLTCLDARTGKPHYGPQRLEGLNGVYASIVGAAHRVYVVGRNGVTMVIKLGPTFERLALNELDEPINASPAIVDDAIFLRGSKSLYCLSEP